MDTQHSGPDEAFARDLAELDRELETRRDPEIPAATLDLVAGLIAGMLRRVPLAMSSLAPTKAEVGLARMVARSGGTGRRPIKTPS